MATTGSGQMVSQNKALAEIGKMLRAEEAQTALAESIPPRLRQSLPVDRAIRSAWQEIMSNPGEMVKCSPRSIIKAVIDAATLGLIVDGVLGQAYLVRFGSTCVFLPGYRGKIALAVRSGTVLDVNPYVIFEGDDFEADFSKHQIIKHKPHWLLGKEPGKCLGYYVDFSLANGGKKIVSMSLAEVNHIREITKRRNHGKESPAWRDAEHEMGKAKVIHRGCKTLDLDPAAALAIMKEDLLVMDDAEKKAKELDPNDLSDLVDVKVGGKLDNLTAEMEKEKKDPATPREDNQEAVGRVKDIQGAIAHMVGEARAEELIAQYVKILVPDAEDVTLEEMNPESLMNLRDQLVVERKSIEKEQGEKEEKEKPFDPEEANAIRGRLIWWVQHAAKEGCDVLTEYVDILGGADGKPPALKEINEWDTAEKMQRIELVFAKLAKRFRILVKELKKAEKAVEEKEKESAKSGSEAADRSGEPQAE